jgi:hypothetical protein
MLFFFFLSLSLKKLSEKTFFFCARVRVYKNVPSFSLIRKKPEWTKKSEGVDTGDKHKGG